MMKQEKMPYVIVMGSDEDMLELSVKESMIMGYILYGNLVINDTGFYQAMILKSSPLTQ